MTRVESQSRADCLEISIVGMRHRLGEVHITAATDFNHGVARNYAFLQSSQRDHRFDRRAGLEPGRESHLLIDDRQDAAGGGIHRQHRTVRVPQRVHRNLADDRVVVRRGIVLARIGVAKARRRCAMRSGLVGRRPGCNSKAPAEKKAK